MTNDTLTDLVNENSDVAARTGHKDAATLQVVNRLDELIEVLEGLRVVLINIQYEGIRPYRGPE